MATSSTFHFVANQMAIDFANTQVMDRGAPADLLDSFDSLLTWLTLAGVLDDHVKRTVRVRFAREQTQQKTLAEAHHLRSIIALIVKAAAGGHDIPDTAIEELNGFLKQTAAYRQLTRGENGFDIQTHVGWDTPAQLLAPVSGSAAELLAHGDLKLIKKCENPDCILHIYDTSKNHSRRWCSMAGCGNRRKVHAFRERARGTLT